MKNFKPITIQIDKALQFSMYNKPQVNILYHRNMNPPNCKTFIR